jgi:Protein of unknown function (DUF3036).
MKQKELSNWLRAIVIIIGLTVLFLSVVFVPNIGRAFVEEIPEMKNMFWPCLLYVWVTVIPVLIALVLGWFIFSEIGADNSFCAANARRLKYICYLAVFDTLLYIASAFILAALNYLHPGVLVIIMCVVFMGVAMSVAAAALSHLTKKAADLKSENELTI